MVVRFQHTWPYLPAFAVSHACFPHPTMSRRAADSAAGRKGWRSQTKGGKQEANGGKLAFIRAVQAFTCHGNTLTSPAFQFNSIDFHVTHRFFVSFLVRPELLPSGKRGFRAAIYTIARPHPHATALCLKKET